MLIIKSKDYPRVIQTRKIKAYENNDAFIVSFDILYSKIMPTCNS